MCTEVFERVAEPNIESSMGRHDLDNEDYQWLLGALGGPGAGTPHDVLGRPSADRPQLYLPLGTRDAGTAALRRYHDGRTRLERMKTRAGIWSARLGMLRFAPGDRTQIGPFAVVERIAQVLGEEDLEVAVTLGPRRRNRKPVLQLLRPNGSTIGFAKVGWSPFAASLVENEADWLDRLKGNVPSNIEIPRVLARINDGERLVVVTSPLQTSPRAGVSGRISASTITRLARSLGTIEVGFDELPYLDVLRSGRVGRLIDVDRLVDVHADTTIELGTWHGDLTPWNTSTSGGVSKVWDWEFADIDRPVGFDLLHNAFELVRRQVSKNEEAALVAVRDRAHVLLASSGQPTKAVIDLYLCELIMLEARLRGEGWHPTDLGPLERHAVDMLNRRLA